MRVHRLSDIVSVSIRYTYVRNGWFYYQRSVPGDLADRYGKATVTHPLRTQSPESAAKLVAKINATLEAEWQRLRDDESAPVQSLGRMARRLLSEWGLKPKGEGRNDPEAIGVFTDYVESQSSAGFNERPMDHLRPVDHQAMELLHEGQKPSLEDALEFYLEWHPKGGDKGFQKMPSIAVEQFVRSVGDKALEDISRDDVRKWMQSAIEQKQAQGTIERRLKALRAIVAAYLHEKELNLPNKFTEHLIPAGAKKAEKRTPFTPDELEKVEKGCIEKDDDIRHAAALMADTVKQFTEDTGRAFPG